MSIDLGRVQALLVDGEIRWSLHFEPSCSSTQDLARKAAAAGADQGWTVITDLQLEGRGRRGRAWVAPRGTALLFSTILQPPVDVLPLLPLLAAISVAGGIEVATGVVAELKWPNDVLVDGKKVAGILTEMSADLDRVHHVVVGIGVNLNVRAFPDELQPIATSLLIARGAPVARADFAAALCARLEHWHDRFVADGAAPVVAAWRQHARFFGKRVQVTAGRDRMDGIAEDLDDDGALRLRLDDGRVVRVVAGELAI